MVNIGEWAGQTTTTTGAGVVTLNGSIPGYSLFSSIGDGELFYTIADGNNRESGIGALAGDVLTRSLITATLVNGVFNDNSPTPLILSGNARVFCTFNKIAYDGLLQEAPIDGEQYVRQDGMWAVSSGGGGQQDYWDYTNEDFWEALNNTQWTLGRWRPINDLDAPTIQVKAGSSWQAGFRPRSVRIYYFTSQSFSQFGLAIYDTQGNLLTNLATSSTETYTEFAPRPIDGERKFFDVDMVFQGFDIAVLTFPSDLYDGSVAIEKLVFNNWPANLPPVSPFVLVKDLVVGSVTFHISRDVRAGAVIKYYKTSDGPGTEQSTEFGMQSLSIGVVFDTTGLSIGEEYTFQMVIYNAQGSMDNLNPIPVVIL